MSEFFHQTLPLTQMNVTDIFEPDNAFFCLGQDQFIRFELDFNLSDVIFWKVAI